MSVLLENEIAIVPAFPVVSAQAKARGARKKTEEDLDTEDDVPVKGGASKKGADDDDDLDDDVDSEVEEDDDWDPDFDEFDVPKSRKGGKGDKDDEDEDFKPEEDDDLKELDLFNDTSLDEDEEDY